MHDVLEFLNTYFTLILSATFIIFLLYLGSRSRKSFDTQAKAYEKHDLSLERQLKGLEMQEEALKNLKESNRLLAEILQALKK